MDTNVGIISNLKSVEKLGNKVITQNQLIEGVLSFKLEDFYSGLF